jgi:hypothetical protein
MGQHTLTHQLLATHDPLSTLLQCVAHILFERSTIYGVDAEMHGVNRLHWNVVRLYVSVFYPVDQS